MKTAKIVLNSHNIIERRIDRRTSGDRRGKKYRKIELDGRNSVQNTIFATRPMKYVNVQP